MIVTSENVFINRKLIEITNIIRNTERNHCEKYGQNEIGIRVLNHVEFFDDRTIKTEIVNIGDYSIIYRINRRIRASNKRYCVTKLNKLLITIETGIKKYVKNTYLKMKIPMGWRRFFLNITNNTQYIYNYCNMITFIVIVMNGISII